MCAKWPWEVAMMPSAFTAALARASSTVMPDLFDPSGAMRITWERFPPLAR